jgi:alkaline phosphatase
VCLLIRFIYHDVQVLHRLKNFIENDTHTLIIATGDNEHLKPVTELTSQYIDFDTSMDSVTSQIFKYEICLNINNIVKP